MDESALLNLFWFLAIGILFYWMMAKGGCGGHGHKHGHSDGQEARSDAETGGQHRQHHSDGSILDDDPSLPRAIAQESRRNAERS